MRNFILVVVALLVTFSVVGCGTSEKLTPSERAEVILYKKYLALPDSTKAALSAGGMVHVKVFNASEDAIASIAYEVLLLNGAEPAPRTEADWTIASKRGVGITSVTVTSKDGSKFADDLSDKSDAETFGQRVADALGTSRKVSLLYPVKK